MLARAVISYLSLRLVMKGGSTILTLKQDDRVWNGIMLHLQIRRRPEPYPLARNMMRSVFWDVEGWILVDYLTRK
jgi:hypothetical protein